MSNDKRPRGRPRGTGKKDAPYLAQVADLMIRDPSLKPTTAMKRVMVTRTGPETDETLIRRWQVKWKATELSLLAAARERMRPSLPAAPTRLTEPAWVLANRIMKQVEDSPINRMMKRIEDSPINLMMKRIEEAPRPFVGWLMLVEDAPESRSPVRDTSPHFPVFPDFQGASYLERYNRRAMVEADNPPASLPSKAANASSKSPVEMPFK